MTAAAEAAEIGHNQPPVTSPLLDRLKEDHADIVRRKNELLDGVAKRVPAAIEDEQTSKEASDFVKQIGLAVKDADTRRVGEKAPFDRSAGEVQAFFKGNIMDPLVDAQDSLRKRITVFQRAEEERKRQEREEAARIAKAAADKARREAEEAAAEARAAEAAAEAARAAEEAARIAAEAEARRAREAEEEAKRKAEDERIARIKSETELAEALKRQEEEAARRAIEDKLRAERDAEAAVQRAKEEAARAEEAAKRKADNEQRQREAARKTEQAEADRVAAEKAAAAVAADLSRQRGDYGSVASLRTTWVFEYDNIGDVDLEALRPYLKQEHVEQAIRAAVKLGIRTIGGVRIFQTKNTQVR
jgi:hypothetical protein